MAFPLGESSLFPRKRQPKAESGVDVNKGEMSQRAKTTLVAN